VLERFTIEQRENELTKLGLRLLPAHAPETFEVQPVEKLLVNPGADLLIPGIPGVCRQGTRGRAENAL
jgi:hypothetical protein